ncbi:MAG: helix-turn-helix transcriptional regulator [Lachnospiraceae bacterium]
MQESRLFKIIYYLLDKGQATAPELAEKFEVSVRTIYRDIDALSSAGIPIYVTTGRKGGIQLLDHYVLDKTLFSESERIEILSGLQSLLAVQYPNADMILNKLGAIFQIHLTDWIEVEFSRWGSNAQVERKLFSDLKQSIFEKRQIVFDYYSAQAMETREVQPLKLVYKDKAWYLYGFCLLRNDFRMFRLSRIKNMALTKIHFKRTIEQGANIFPEPDDFGNLIDLELYFPLEVGFRLFDTLDDSVIKKQENGYKVNLTLPENEWLYDFLMSFGDKVTIIHPKSLRQKIINICEAALTHHMKKDNSNLKA